MSDMGAFFIGAGLFFLGWGIDSGLSAIARAIKRC
jgi:hypothetical protein